MLDISFSTDFHTGVAFGQLYKGETPIRHDATTPHHTKARSTVTRKQKPTMTHFMCIDCRFLMDDGHCIAQAPKGLVKAAQANKKKEHQHDAVVSPQRAIHDCGHDIPHPMSLPHPQTIKVLGS